MAIPENVIEQVQDKSDIVAVISRYIPLKKLGRNYKALCPFHNEKTPSFIVSPDKQIYHCFGCGAEGNVFSFLMRYEKEEFPEAVEMLAEEAGIPMPHSAAQKGERASFANQLYKINELASQFFCASLANNSIAKEYLNSRGAGNEAVESFKIGYAPNSWEGVLNFFRKRGVGEAALEKAGLVIRNEEKGTYYDRFRHRIIFPIMDLRSRTLGFGARVLDSSLPKYVNSPETYIYSKGKHLYGLNLSKDHIRKEGYALVVEGYMDFIIPYQAGIKNLVATLGTALTIDQVKLLKRFTNRVIMAYDPDEAGEAASLRNLDIFIAEDVNVYIAELPGGYDPDNYIKKFGTEDFLTLMKASRNLFDYKFEHLSRQHDVKTAHGKANIASLMLPTIARISNAILKSNLVKKLADRLAVDEESIKTELKKVKPDYTEERYLENSASEAKRDSKSAERMVLALLLDGGNFISEVKERLSLEEFKDSSVRDVVKAAFDLYEDKKNINPARLISYLENSSDSATLISEAAGLSEIVIDKERTLRDCIARIKADNVKDQLAMLQQAIKTAYDSNDEEKVRELVIKYDGLLKETGIP